MSELIRRVAAAQATLDRFKGIPIDWKTADCARMAAHCLAGMGHQIRRAKFGLYSNEVGALRTLKRGGFADLGEVLDRLVGLPRIPPAAALPADILAVQAESFGGLSLMIAVGNGRLFGFGPDGVGAVLRPLIPPCAAWRA